MRKVSSTFLPHLKKSNPDRKFQVFFAAADGPYNENARKKQRERPGTTKKEEGILRSNRLAKWLSLILCAAMVTAFLAACGGRGGPSGGADSPSPSSAGSTGTGSGAQETPQRQETVRLKFLTGKVETVEWMNELIKKFEAEHPGIQVEQEYQKDASNVIKVKFASGDVPDITTVVTQDYIDQGKYLDLTDEPFWDRIEPAIKDLSSDIKTGRTYKVATNMTMAGIFYNKRIFEELGLKEAETWEEFYNNLQTIREKKPDVVPMFLGGKDSWTLGHLIEFIAHGYIKQQLGIMGARKAFIENDQSKLQFVAPGGYMEVFARRMLELKDAGLVNKDLLTATYDDQKQEFAAGRAAVISQGMWVLADLLKLNPEVKDWIGFSPFPPIVDGTKPVILSAEDSAYAITSESKHQEEAKLFLNYLFRPENQKAYSEYLQMPSAFKDVDADWGVLKDEAQKALAKGVPIAFTDWPSGFSGDDAGRMMQELFAGKYKTPAEFAQAYAEAWNKGWSAVNR